MSKRKLKYKELLALTRLQLARIEQLQRRIAKRDEQSQASYQQMGPFRDRETLTKQEAA